MTRRLRWLVLASVGALVVPSRAPAEDAPGPDLKALLGEVKKVVGKHYPGAKVALEGSAILFEFNTRKFMIHERTLLGEWQDPVEVVGPQGKGVVGRLELRRGQYGGMLVLPHQSDKRYFTVELMAPYSEKLDHHLNVELMYPADAPKGFLKDFYRLVNEFDNHVRAAGE